MCIETHYIEYKDYHREESPSEKAVLAKLFREVSAFANASGGEIVVGKEDKTGKETVQPDCIYNWLENDRLATSINKMSDNLVVISSIRKEKLVHIRVQESDDVISAQSDTKGINKGDCFVRENHESIKVQGNKLKSLLEKKSLSEDKKLRALRKIVHYKMSNGMSHAQQINIFDSLFVSVSLPHDYINVVFDAWMKNEFIMGHRLPISKYSTMQMHFEICDKKFADATLIQKNREAFDLMMNSNHTRECFYSAHLDEVLCSPQLKAYILEYKAVIEGL